MQSRGILLVPKIPSYKIVFLLEHYEDGAVPELGTAIQEACRYQNWIDQDKTHVCFLYEKDEYHLCEMQKLLRPENIIPIGSIEFVNRFLERIGKSPLIALNIPSEISDEEFTMRKIFRNKDISDLPALSKEYGPLIIKPERTPKLFEAEIYEPQKQEIFSRIPKNEPLFVSQKLSSEIVSEWRVFCRYGAMLDIRPYILDEWVFPDKIIVERMLSRLYRYPAITLDVAVLEDGRTVALETHNFVSCGFYGFGGPKMLKMTKMAWAWELMKEYC